MSQSSPQPAVDPTARERRRRLTIHGPLALAHVPLAQSSAAVSPTRCRLASPTVAGVRTAALLVGLTLPIAVGGCAPRAADVERPQWALAIHGGAGKISREISEEKHQAYLASLTAVLGEGRDRLARGERSLDVAEELVRRMEDDPLFNAGRGAVFTVEGTHELDAAIMDGATLACGAVTGVTTVRHPITLARRVMEKTGHVLLAGLGAERFADEQGVERVTNDWFSTPERREAWEKKRSAASGGTVGAVALDRAGHLAAATSTGGLLNKRWGRVGDTPIVGAGTYADDRTVAVSCTGEGEEFIRHGVARDLSALVRYRGLSVSEAAHTVIFERLRPEDGGLIAVGRDGSMALVYSTAGMLRGAADEGGRFEVAIWE